MISCSAARAHMLDVARGAASEAVSLEVEEHVEECAACDQECGRWKLFGVLRDYVPPQINDQGERRILEHLLSVGVGSEVPPAVVRRSPRLLVGAVSMAALGLAAVLLFQRPVGTGVGGVAENQLVDAAAPGTVSFGGAEVRYETGTRMTLHPQGRTVSLARGEIEVDVKPGLPGHFRVATPKFVVEVLGTRFVVTMGSVRTRRGRVHVLDVDGRELAMLTAGGSWSLPERQPTAAQRPAPTPLLAPLEVPASAAHQSAPVARQVAVADWLARSRSALARGDAKQARQLAQHALAAGPTEREAATSEMLLADALLVEKRPDDAIEAYRRVVRRRGRAPEAEVAQFAVGQLLFERGATAEATVAFNDYVARYPMGRFVREAREHLALTRPRK